MHAWGVFTTFSTSSRCCSFSASESALLNRWAEGDLAAMLAPAYSPLRPPARYSLRAGARWSDTSTLFCKPLILLLRPLQTRLPPPFSVPP